MSSVKRKKAVKRSRKILTVDDRIERLAQSQLVRDASLASLIYAVSLLPKINRKSPVVDAGDVLFCVLMEQCAEWLIRNRGVR